MSYDEFATDNYLIARQQPVVFLSFKTVRKPNYLDFMPSFKAPGNYGETKAAEYVEKRRQEWIDKDSMTNPSSSQLNNGYCVILENTDATKETKSGEFLSWADLTLAIKEAHTGPGALSPHFIGFDIRRSLKIYGLAAAADSKPIPIHWWCQANFTDLGRLLSPLEDTDPIVTLKSLIPAFNPAVHLGSPMADAQLCWHVSQILGLVAQRQPAEEAKTKTKVKK